MGTCILELGTRSFRVMHAALDRGGALVSRELSRERVALDRAIDDDGAISKEAGADALASVGRLLTAAKVRAPLADVHAIAPDALSSAVNASTFVRAIERRYRISVSLLSPRDTTHLAHRGVRADLRLLAGRAVIAHLGDAALDLGTGTRAALDVQGTVPAGIPRLHRAFGGTRDGLNREDATALFSIVRLTAGPLSRRLRDADAPALVVSSEHAGAVRDVARAWGFLDDRTESLGRVALRALTSEILGASVQELEAGGAPGPIARFLGTTAVTIDALSDLLGQREVLFSHYGPAEGAAMSVLEELEASAKHGPAARLAAGAGSRGRY